MSLEQQPDEARPPLRLVPQEELAHKLLNLIAASSSYVGLLRATDLDSEQTEMLDEMKDICDSAVTLGREIEDRLRDCP